MCIPGPGAGHPPARNAHAQVSGQQRSQGLPGAQQCSEPAPVRYQCTHGAAGNPLADRPGCEPFCQLTADVEQSPVADAFRAGRLAGAAAQAAVKVVQDVAGEAAPLERLQGIARGHVGSTRRTTLQHLLDQVDAAARTVPLVAQQSEGGTAERALTALHTGAEQFGTLAAQGSVSVAFGQLDLQIAAPGALLPWKYASVAGCLSKTPRDRAGKQKSRLSELRPAFLVFGSPSWTHRRYPLLSSGWV